MGKAITGKQRAARKRNIAVARAAKKKGSKGKKKYGKRTTIDQAAAVLKKRGMTITGGKFDLKKGVSTYKVKGKGGKSGTFTSKQIMDYINKIG